VCTRSLWHDVNNVNKPCRYEGGQQPLKGTWISVSKYKLSEGSDDVSFSLEPKAGEDVERNRGFQLKALTPDEKDEWMEKIAAAASYDLSLAREEAVAADDAYSDDGSDYSGGEY